ncbi:aspartate/glutamate racemase family protein [Labrenzia sp. OB1]|uniref:aspartate/glutamate racemase family protein n=1 Tax=Labrenzia sp. OB1 TaxID=1561204 RepID=UPI0007B30277|nr:aspartate/glutamate racemase family protein [Labrenzia sp. OB1]KZM47670.1 racemase [Labrenzia sp. OB1]
MKTIGLLGGMSWESTATYYQMLNRMARERLGGLHSAKCFLWSFDFAEIEAAQAAGDWDKATELMVEAARNLERGGAQCLVICTNTMHKMAGQVQEAVSMPLIHIADATAPAIREAGCKAPLLLATAYTMEQDFYKGHLKDRHAIDVRVPQAEDREEIHRIIYEELCRGEIWADSKQTYLEAVAREKARGADGVIFGCTEIGLLVKAEDFDIPAFDTTALHAKAALDFALDV